MVDWPIKIRCISNNNVILTSFACSFRKMWIRQKSSPFHLTCKSWPSLPRSRRWSWWCSGWSRNRPSSFWTFWVSSNWRHSFTSFLVVLATISSSIGNTPCRQPCTWPHWFPPHQRANQPPILWKNILFTIRWKRMPWPRVGCTRRSSLPFHSKSWAFWITECKFNDGHSLSCLVQPTGIHWERLSGSVSCQDKITWVPRESSPKSRSSISLLFLVRY